MIDSVLSYHMNGSTCGVAKFNQRLARELDVPCLSLTSDESRLVSYPLVSIKPSEIPLMMNYYWYTHDVFFHEWENTARERQWAEQAKNVYAANQEIASRLREVRPDVVEAWCPSTIEGNPTRGTINVLTFGMAHKIQTARYEKLKALLDATGEDYTVSVSTAVHEGSPWGETSEVAGRMAKVFGNRLRVLGFIADDAIAKELRDCTAVALFFDPALRANNTTFWAAHDAGKTIVTTLDDTSPEAHGVFDIDILKEWPDVNDEEEGRWFRDREHSWSKLLSLMQAQPCAK